jgi:hypothetical protein
VDQAGFVRLDAAVHGDFELGGLGRVSTSLRFVRVSSTAGPRGRGTSSVFRVMTVSSAWAAVEIEDMRMGGPPGGELRSVAVERAFAGRNDLKASGRRRSRNPGRPGERSSCEHRLRFRRDPAQGMRGWWSSGRRRRRVPILRCGKSDRSWIAVASDGPRERRGGRGLPGSVVAVKTGYRSRRPALTSFPAARRPYRRRGSGPWTSARCVRRRA